MKSTKIPARFKGKCAKCGASVAKGDPVYWKKHFGVKCEACGPHTAEDQPTKSKVKSRKATDTQPSTTEPQTTKKESPKKTKTQHSHGGYSVQTYYQGNVFHVEWDSLKDVLDVAFDRNLSAVRKNGDHVNKILDDKFRGHGEWGNGFTKHKFYQELESPSGFYKDKIDEFKDKIADVSDIQPSYKPRRKRRRNLDAGSEIDVDKFLNRNPQMWESMKKTPFHPASDYWD